MCPSTLQGHVRHHGQLLDPIPPALQDRMEVLELAGYIEEEKVEIAGGTLIPAAGTRERTHREYADTIDSQRPASEDHQHYTREAAAKPRARDRPRLPQGGTRP